MQNEQYVVGWLTLSLLIAGVAQGKHRSGLGWWLLGLLFGPIALVILLLLDPAPDPGGMEDRIAARISDELRRMQHGGAG